MDGCVRWLEIGEKGHKRLDYAGTGADPWAMATRRGQRSGAVMSAAPEQGRREALVGLASTVSETKMINWLRGDKVESKRRPISRPILLGHLYPRSPPAVDNRESSLWPVREHSESVLLDSFRLHYRQGGRVAGRQGPMVPVSPGDESYVITPLLSSDSILTNCCTTLHITKSERLDDR